MVFSVRTEDIQVVSESTIFSSVLDFFLSRSTTYFKQGLPKKSWCDKSFSAECQGRSCKLFLN